MNILDVRVVSPSGDLYKLKARSVSSNNSAGRFDILPKHANFVTFIANKKIDIVLENKQQVQLDYPVSIIKAGKDQVTIFVDVESLKSI